MTTGNRQKTIFSQIFDVLVVGGGKALMNAYYATAARLGVQIVYGATVGDLEIVDHRFASAEVVVNNLSQRVRAKSVVIASGGFQADLE